jgi:beta-glucanase (GH16 family)
MSNIHAQLIVGSFLLVLAASGAGCIKSSETKNPPTVSAGPAQTAGRAQLPAEFRRGDQRYTLAWVEDFEAGLGNATLGNWTFDTNAVWFHANNAKVNNNALLLSLSERGTLKIDSDRKYLGAEYDRQGAQLYGRFVTRMRPVVPAGVIASFFTAFYKFTPNYDKMLETAEIDIEFVGGTDSVQFALHWIDASGEKHQTAHKLKLPFDASQAFHVWEIEWLSDRVVFYADNKELHRFTDAAILAELRIPQEVKANVWISTSVPWAGEFNPRALPVETAYDYIAAYRLADAAQ